MSTNLVSLALQYLTPKLIAKIASSLGVDKSLIGKAVTAALPAIIGSIAGVASKPGGAKQLDTVLGQHSPGILDTFASSIGGAGQQALVKSGIGALTSLLGGTSVPTLAGVLGKFAGLNQGTSTSLLGLLAPAVMGLVAKQKAEQGLDASGLSRLLAAQKDHVAAVLPPGFSELLKGTDLPGFSKEATYAAPVSSPRASKPTAWWMWLIPLAALAAIGWWLLGDRGSDVPVKQAVRPAVETARPIAPQPVPSLKVGEVDLRATLEKTFSGLKSTLQGVSDAATAEAAVPELQSAVSELEKVSGLSEQLPAAGKSALAALVTAARPSLEELFAKIMAIPGVAVIASPLIDSLRAQLDAIAKV